MLKKILLSLSVVGALFAVSGCCGGAKENAAATNFCRLNKSDESCKACCTSQRASSSSFVGGACKCRQ